mmetsp:Transcript_10208/g.30839  ORF Transcript_10208/g.30839 Transcript_10208/m.30839 type:complete len:259 (-) Transcript_10208:1708-2484(-)
MRTLSRSFVLRLCKSQASSARPTWIIKPPSVASEASGSYLQSWRHTWTIRCLSQAKRRTIWSVNYLPKRGCQASSMSTQRRSLVLSSSVYGRQLSETGVLRHVYPRHSVLTYSLNSLRLAPKYCATKSAASWPSWCKTRKSHCISQIGSPSTLGVLQQQCSAVFGETRRSKCIQFWSDVVSGRSPLDMVRLVAMLASPSMTRHMERQYPALSWELGPCGSRRLVAVAALTSSRRSPWKSHKAMSRWKEAQLPVTCAAR